MKKLATRYLALSGLTIILLVSGCQATVMGMTITVPPTYITPTLPTLPTGAPVISSTASPALDVPASPTLTTLPPITTRTTTATYIMPTLPVTTTVAPPASTTLPPVTTTELTTVVPGSSVPPTMRPTKLPASVAQITLAEIFMYPTWTECPDALYALERVAVDPKMILLEYNIYDSNSELGYMFGSYTVVGTPNVVFNGGQWFDPALSKEYGRNIISGPQSYEAYKARFDLLKSQQTTARITSVEVQTSPRLTATIEVTNLSSSEMDNARLYAVVYEDMRVSGSRYKVLDITPVEDKVRLAAGESKLFDLKSSITSNANRHMVVILKSSTGLVLQALKVR